MVKLNSSFTLYFEKPFWVGVFIKETEEGIEASKVVFGSEPSNKEVMDFIQNNYHLLIFSPVLSNGKKIKKKQINPKRKQRLAKKMVNQKGIGTKAQEALKLQYELVKQKKRKENKHNKISIKQEKFELQQLKKKNKHRGH